MRQQVSETEDSSSGYVAPYILEFEGLALRILKGDVNDREKLKELLEEYADKYAKESSLGA